MYRSSTIIGLLTLLGGVISVIEGTTLPPTRLGRGGVTVDPAQGSNNTACSSSSGFNIQSQGDLDSLGNCETVIGTINITAVGFSQVTLPSTIVTVEGDVTIAQTSSVSSFSASGLEKITGTFTLLNLTALSSITAGSLTSVGGIYFSILPVFQTMSLGISDAGDVLISDTQLSSLSGLSLSSVNSFDIDNNRYLNTISQPELKEINGPLTIFANSGQLPQQLSASFPALTSVQNATFRNIQSIGLDSLQNVSQSLGFFDSTMQTISAPNLTSVGQSLSFVNCSQLTNVSFPKLTDIGGTFLIANNSALKDISGFDDVQTIGGSIDWTGSFDNASLPSITDVSGGVNVQSSSNIFQCPFPNLQNNGVVKGKGFVCTGKVAHPSSGLTGANVTANQGPDNSSSSKSDAPGKATMSPFGFAGVGVLVALAIQFLT